MTVEQAREQRVCRICGKPCGRAAYQPKGWTEDFNEQVYPERITLAFGKEFAHTACLEAEAAKGASQ